MIPIETHLSEKGYAVDNIILLGHATTPEAHAEIIWTEYVTHAQKRLDKLKQNCSKCYACGLSMRGGPSPAQM